MDQLKVAFKQLSAEYEIVKAKLISMESYLNLANAMLLLSDTDKKEIEKEFYSYQELSELLGIPVPSLQTLVCKKEIPYYKQNGVKFRKAEILDWMNKSRICTVDEAISKINI